MINLNNITVKMNKPSRHLLLIDLYSAGHHSGYIKQLCDYWTNRQILGKVTLVVSKNFALNHQAIYQFLNSRQSDRFAIKTHHFRSLNERKSILINLVLNDLQYGMCSYRLIKQFRPDRVLFLLMDHLQLSLALGLRMNYGVEFGGILFRPTLHYENLGYQPVSPKERIWFHRKKMTLKLALTNRHFNYLFSLDPYAIPYIRKLSKGIICRYLPDGFTYNQQRQVKLFPSIQQEKENGRLILLFFGRITERKGIFQVLRSFEHVTPKVQKKLCLWIAGRSKDNEYTKIQSLINKLQEITYISIVWDNFFILEDDIQQYFKYADLVLVTYQKHIGSSQVLIRAAAEGIPALGSNFGLVGEYIRRFRLGAAIDTINPLAIAAFIDSWAIDRSILSFDRESAKKFALKNGSTQFCRTIFETMM